MLVRRNGIGSVGTVVAFVLGAVDVQLKGQLWANVACFLAAAPGLLYVAWNVTNPGEDEAAPSGTLTPQSVTYEEKEKDLRGVEVPPLTTRPMVIVHPHAALETREGPKQYLFRCFLLVDLGRSVRHVAMQ